MNTINVFIGLATSQNNKGAYSLCLHTDTGMYSLPPVIVCENRITEKDLTCRAITDFFHEIEAAGKAALPDKVVFYTTSEYAKYAIFFPGYDKKNAARWEEIKKKARELHVEVCVNGPSSDLVKISKAQNRRAKTRLKSENNKTTKIH